MGKKTLKKKAIKRKKVALPPVPEVTFESELRDLLNKYDMGIKCELKMNPVFFKVSEAQS